MNIRFQLLQHLSGKNWILHSFQWRIVEAWKSVTAKSKIKDITEIYYVQPITFFNKLKKVLLVGICLGALMLHFNEILIEKAFLKYFCWNTSANGRWQHPLGYSLESLAGLNYVGLWGKLKLEKVLCFIFCTVCHGPPCSPSSHSYSKWFALIMACLNMFLERFSSSLFLFRKNIFAKGYIIFQTKCLFLYFSKST